MFAAAACRAAGVGFGRITVIVIRSVTHAFTRVRSDVPSASAEQAYGPQRVKPWHAPAPLMVASVGRGTVRRGAQVDFFITAVDFGNEPEPEKVRPHAHCNTAQRAAAYNRTVQRRTARCNAVHQR